MNNTELESQLAQIAQNAYEAGSPVASDVEKIAVIARRRWQSSSKRIKSDSIDAKVADLAKGLMNQLEANPELAGPLKSDYAWLAQQLASALKDV